MRETVDTDLGIMELKQKLMLKRIQELELARIEAARWKAEKEARIREAKHKEVKEARLKAEEEARLKAEEEARLKAEEEARLKAEGKARLKTEEEARLKAQKEAILKAQEDAKAVEKRCKAQEERKMNERIALEEETRLEKERWLVQEQMQQVQEKHKMRMKAEKQKCSLEERCKRMEELKQFLKQESDEDMEVPQAIEKVLVFKGERAQMLSVNPDAVAQPVIVGEGKGLSRDSSKVPLIPANNEMCEGKEETPVDVIRDKVKDDINPAIFSKETLDLEDDEIEEEKSKFFKRKLKKLSRKTVAELQQKVNLKASSNIILVLHHWCFKGKQDKPAWKLLDVIKRVGIMKMGQALRERDDQKTMKAKMWKRKRRKLRKSHIDNQKLGNSAPERRPCMEISVLKGKPFPSITGPKKDGKERTWVPLPLFLDSC
ncbi:splicing factor 3B subunit 2 [Trichonephila clavata]|uniref:Splicing factor 3B subunit 2 n=1 Tax=Trichonephila clavata TaxID=2740835 RepID=A0A8X6K8T5_TRICU|nr:splicing factor 3B subunit 2 [Trichonephila clavata]